MVMFENNPRTKISLHLIIVPTITALLGLLIFPTKACAAEQTATFRVFGLFQPDRAADLRELITSKISGVVIKTIDYEKATVVLAFDPEKALNKAKPEQYLERLDNLVRPASNGTFSLLPDFKIQTGQLQRIEIMVAGLDCKACGFAAYEVVAKIDGVERATVSFREGRLLAWVDPSRVDKAALVKALVQKRVEVKMPSLD
jgi:hypothetical protein